MSKWWCFFGVHEWEIADKYNVTYWHNGVGVVHVMRCRCCGEMKTRHM